MTVFDYDLSTDSPTRIGLVVLQTDQRIEQDFRRLLPDSVQLFVSRVPSGLQVTPETLQHMANDIPAAASLLPPGLSYDAIGYGCTSGAAQIGPDRIAHLIRQSVQARSVSDPVSALIAAANALGIKRLAFLSPYIESVSGRLREVLCGAGIGTPVFGTFAEAEEARVVRIAPHSLIDAACKLTRDAEIDGVFLSCTNLDTLDIIAPLEAETGLPVLSSNLVLAWHLCRLANCTMRDSAKCRLEGVQP